MGRLDKERELELQPLRKQYAKDQILARGLVITMETDDRLEFELDGNIIRVFPYSGWFSGKGIKDGRGIQHLLTQIDNRLSACQQSTTNTGSGTGFVENRVNLNPSDMRIINPDQLTLDTDTKHLISGRALAVVLRTEKNNHGAEFTVKSKQTGKDYTFKLERSEYNQKWYTHIKVEQGYLNFVKLGTYMGGIVKRKGAEVATPAAKAIAWVLRHVEREQFQILDSNVEIYHLGKCLVCGQTLTDSTSIEIGLGPICRKR